MQFSIVVSCKQLYITDEHIPVCDEHILAYEHKGTLQEPQHKNHCIVVTWMLQMQFSVKANIYTNCEHT